MAQPTREQTEDLLLEIGKWSDGLVNARPGKDIPKTALQDAVNVDISDIGTIKRRRGSHLEIAATSKSHSCFADDYGLYFVDGDKLMRSTPKDGVWLSQVLRDGMSANVPVYWTKTQGQTWFSNGTQNGKISSGTLLPFSVEPPAGPPGLSVTSGSLSPGRYGVAISFINEKGEESGTQERIIIELTGVVASSGGIALSNIPSPQGSDIAYVRIYVSDANGTVLYKYADMPAGTSTVVISRNRSKGMPLMNELIDSFPPSVNIHAWRGYMLGNVGKILYWSEPQRFGLCQLDCNFMIFEEPITMIAPVDDGFYVVSSKTYFISGGEPDKWIKQEVLPYGGAVPGTFARHPNRVEVVWFSEFGEIFAKNSGSIRNETLEKIAPKRYSRGASLFRRVNGVEQIVNTFPDSGMNQVMGASSFVDAEIIRAKLS